MANTAGRIVQIKQDSTEYYRDLYYTEHATREVVDADLASVNAAYTDLLDSVRRRTGAKDKDLQAVTAVGMVTAGKVVPGVSPVRGRDSLQSYNIRYDDRWLSLAGRVGDSSIITYQVRDSLIFTIRTRRVGLFKKETIIDGYSLNPAVHITGITGIRIAAGKSQRFRIGPYVGYGWDGNRWAPSAGVSIQYSLIRF